MGVNYQGIKGPNEPYTDCVVHQIEGQDRQAGRQAPPVDFTFDFWPYTVADHAGAPGFPTAEGDD